MRLVGLPPALAVSEPMTIPAETRVCPRCGSPAQQAVYCSTCGLHLHALDEVPTRQEWASGQASAANKREARMPKNGVRTWFGRRRMLMTVLAVVSALVVAGVALLISTGGKTEDHS